MCFWLGKFVKIRNLSRSVVPFGERDIPPFGTLTISRSEYFSHAANGDADDMPILVQIDESMKSEVSVSDFGAAGDGVSDDTQAIQSAIDYVSLSGGGIVHIPVGVYNVGTLYILSDISLLGDSKMNTVLRSNASSGSSILVIEGVVANISRLRMVI